MRIVLRFFGFLFTVGFFGFLALAAVVGVGYTLYSDDLPDHAALAEYEPAVMSRVHAADGTLVAEYARERRLYLPIETIPKQLINAFLSAEDKNFYRHRGIDPEGIVRAIVTNLTSGATQGASTITQQVAKNFLLTSEQTYDRKIREALIALRMEATFTKDRILELYLNEIFLGTLVPGRNLHGVAAAALDYFDKSVHELTLAEMAYLAALPKAPNNYHPFRERENAIGRRNWVLDRMTDNGFITAEEAEIAKAEPLEVTGRRISPDLLGAGYFVEEARRAIAARYGDEALYEGGLSIRTTLDPAMQAMARKALIDGLVRYDEERGGWRGPVQTLEIGGPVDWGAALAGVRPLGDVRPWELAVVLEVSNSGARIGLRPERAVSGQIAEERVTGTISPEGVRWTGRSLDAALDPGDVIYVERQPGGDFRLRQVPQVSGAIVAMDPHTGRVHAMVGGFSYDQSEFNRATQALRQPGSSFKPFVYATALDNGYTPSSIVLDEPISVEAGGTVWSPNNYDGRPTGPRTLRYGIERSKNLMTVRLAQDIGMPLVVEYARRFGVVDDMLPVLSMSLGAGETTVLRMVTGYSMFVNGGKRIRSTLIDRIQDRNGQTIFQHDRRECVGCVADAWRGQDEPQLVDDREQVLDPLTAYQITSMMEGVVERGTATVVREVGKPLAGKTGTTNDAKDVWFVGFSPDLAVGVYIGFDQPRTLGANVTSGRYAAPIFRDFMQMALADEPATPFRVPPGIKLIPVNATTGLRAGAGDTGVILEAFKPGTAPPDNYAFVGGFGPESEAPTVAPEALQSIGSGTGGLY